MRQDSVKLLSGGNPQIEKGEGDKVVQAYITAMPGWKREVGQELDRLITQTIPKVQKAVRWNSPFYGIKGKGWFLSFHCFSKYIKVAFLRGASLQPPPPIESKDPDARYLHIPEDGQFDEVQFKLWLKQAAKTGGQPLF